MNVSISVPNDHGSEPDAILMIAELYDGDLQACECDDGRQALDLLADTARDAGLKFVEETDFGAVWSGAPDMGQR